MQALSGADATLFTIPYAALFFFLVWQLAFCYIERPAKARPRPQRQLDGRIVAAIVPAYNEDPAALRACLASMIDQTRRPDIIVVVDDGSPLADEYPRIREWFLAACAMAGIRGEWVRQANGGKRHAQATGVRMTPDADFYWTVDSDGISDPGALHQLLQPMGDQRVQSVAGIVLAANVRGRGRFLTRFTDLWFVTGQLTDRSSLSALGSVWVNSGPIALYRAGVLRDNLDTYLEETFFGRRVPFSDDSMLTLFAMLRGRTVQQPTAFCYSLMPEKVSHHLRQFVRWMRGSFIRSWWRMRYLSVRSYAYWAHLLRWVQMVLSSAVMIALIVAGPLGRLNVTGWAMLVAVPLAIGYCQTLRYMCVRRNDQSRLYQWGTWLLTPVALIWAVVVLRAVRWYGVITCWRTGWGTRKSVEVTL